jgi:hypothetical protein
MLGVCGTDQVLDLGRHSSIIAVYSTAVAQNSWSRLFEPPLAFLSNSIDLHVLIHRFRHFAESVIIPEFTWNDFCPSVIGLPADPAATRDLRPVPGSTNWFGSSSDT